MLASREAFFARDPLRAEANELLIGELFELGDLPLRRFARGGRNALIGEEGGGSSAYVPEDKTKDLQLKAALDFLHGVKVVTNVKPKEEKPSSAGTNSGSDTSAN